MRKLSVCVGMALLLACLWMAAPVQVGAQTWDQSVSPWRCDDIACEDLSFGFAGANPQRWPCYDQNGNPIGWCDCDMQDTNVHRMCTYNYNAQTTCIYTNDSYNRCDGNYTPPGGNPTPCSWLLQLCL
jgi:hypothetical protein